MASFGVDIGVSMTKGLKGFITLVLVVMYLVNLKSHGVEAKTKVEQFEDDLELERQLKLLNKPSLKTITTEEGDILDCVDFYKQPAFDHSLLKDHKIQKKPSFFPKGEANKTSSPTEALQISMKLEECPQGTVPIRRTSKEDLLRVRALSRDFTSNISQSKKLFPGQFIVDVNDEEPGLVHGASAFINVYNLNVLDSQSSSAQIWINGGPNENPNYIMAGWTVDPGLYGDHFARLFTFWTGDGYRNGCYNTLCRGFVQVSRSQTPSTRLPHVSTVGGTQYSIKVYVYQDRQTGNWWLVLGSNDVHVGYWPKSLFTYLGDGAKGVSWGGLVMASPNGDCPPMGSGHIPDDGYACFFRWLEFVDEEYKIAHPLSEQSIKTRVDAKNCYGLSYQAYEPGQGAGFTFGGPGGPGTNCF